MKCPKCGGEIAFYDLRPNCKHCGVNIYYYTQDSNLIRDAKRTELESAAARMVVARIKATFIGGKLQIARLVFVLTAICAILVPFGTVHYTAPFFEETFSAGLIGLIQSFTDGFAMKLLDFIGSSMFARFTLPGVIMTGCILVITIIDLVTFCGYLLSFLNINKGTRFLKRMAVIGMIFSMAAQITSLVLSFVFQAGEHASYSFGFGGLVSFAGFLVLFILNRMIDKKGIEPTYREFDPKRREMLKQYRAGELDLDTLSLPIFESEEERAQREADLKAALESEGVLSDE